MQMFVAYSPVQMPGATWVIIAMQPYYEVFSRLPMIQLQGAIVVASVIAAGLGFLIFGSRIKHSIKKWVPFQGVFGDICER